MLRPSTVVGCLSHRCERLDMSFAGAMVGVPIHGTLPGALGAAAASTAPLTYTSELFLVQENWPKIQFHALREHAGLVFQKQLDG